MKKEHKAKANTATTQQATKGKGNTKMSKNKKVTQAQDDALKKAGDEILANTIKDTKGSEVVGNVAKEVVDYLYKQDFQAYNCCLEKEFFTRPFTIKELITMCDEAEYFAPYVIELVKRHAPKMSAVYTVRYIEDCSIDERSPHDTEYYLEIVLDDIDFDAGTRQRHDLIMRSTRSSSYLYKLMEQFNLTHRDYNMECLETPND